VESLSSPGAHFPGFFYIKNYRREHGENPLFNLKAYGKLIQLEAISPMSGGVLYFLSGYIIRLVRTLLLLAIWKAVFSYSNGAAPGQLVEVLRYTLLAAILWEQVDVQTTASLTFWEGTAFSRFLRPLSVFGQYIAETLGKWIPGLLFFSIPVLLLSPLLGIDIRPINAPTLFLFIESLIIGILSGFAMDFILTGVMVYLGNAHYIASQIRAALTLLFSGALIPLYLMPFGIGRVLGWLPFATMASAPLSIYTGTAENVMQVVLLQLGWCVILWLTAMYIWKKNRQKLVIFGG
jgi:ABC-2 type transport system permease protein